MSMMGPAMPPQQAMARSAYATIDQSLDGKTGPAEVNLRPAESPNQSCGACGYFQAPDTCQMIAGKVAAQAVCDQFEPAENPDSPELGEGMNEPVY